MRPRTDEAGITWYPSPMWAALCKQSTEIGCMHQRAVALQNELDRQLKECQAKLAEANHRADEADQQRKTMMEQVRSLHQRLADL